MSESNSTYGHIEELIDLVKGYVKQETVDPLRTLAKRFGLGLAAAVMFGLSSVFLALAVLRGIERYAGFATRGILSALPYVVVAILLGLAIFMVWSRQTREKPGGQSG